MVTKPAAQVHQLAFLAPSGDRGPLVDHIKDPRPLDDLVLSAETRAIIGRVLNENQHADQLLAQGLRPSNRVLFCGPPGCGKTVAAGAIALALDLPLAAVRLDSVIGSFMGTTASHLRQVFDLAKHQRVVLFLDEFDAIGRARDGDGRLQDVGEIKRVVNSLLVMLEEIRGPSVVVAATNNAGILDAALWRRFDEIVMFPPPDGNQGVALLNRLIGRYNALPRDPRRWGRYLAGMSFADVERVALDAMKTLALADNISIEGALVAAVRAQRARRALTSRAKAARK